MSQQNVIAPDPTKDPYFGKLPAIPNTFQIGLSLGGTAGAGPWTAGALDFLLRALDAWKADPQIGPLHEVQFPIVGGTSGGAVCAALLGLVSRRAFSPITGGAADHKRSYSGDNPFWLLWVETLDRQNMFDEVDLKKGALLSLLDSGAIDKAYGMMVDLSGVVGKPFVRPYFPDPMRLLITIANIEGIPYRFPVAGFTPWRGAPYSSHADFARFAISSNGAGAPRPDEFWINPSDPKSNSFSVLADYARASGAMPGIFPARPLNRPASHLPYRPVATRDSTGKLTLGYPQPDEASLAKLIDKSGTYFFTAVDGGTFNHTPLSLVHDTLAGAGQFLDGDETTVDRAVLLIDPLAASDGQIDPVGQKIGQTPTLLNVLGPLIGAIVDGGTYLTTDLHLFAAEHDYSHFQIVPNRQDLGKVGDEAVPGALFQTLGGFLCRDFRVHDFLLGQINMQSFLREKFTLHQSNKLFSNWNAAQKGKFAVTLDGQKPNPAAMAAGKYYLPIIPDLTPTLALANNPWPKKALNTNDIASALKNRLESVIDVVATGESSGLKAWLINRLVDPFALDGLVNGLKNELDDELKKADLN